LLSVIVKDGNFENIYCHFKQTVLSFIPL